MKEYPKKKLSKTLHKRTRLNPEQLSRVAGGYGGGEIAKYGPDGVQNLALTRAYAKTKSTAKRFVLFSDRLGRRVFLADAGKTVLVEKELPLTFEISQALHFVAGFDDADRKKAYYNDWFQVAIEVKFNWLTKTI